MLLCKYSRIRNGRASPTSTFGSIGVVASNFLTIYQIPLGAVSVAIPILALYSIHIRLTRSCAIDYVSSSTNNVDSHHDYDRNRI